MKVWIGDGDGGGLVAEADAHVPASDRGLLVGEGVFETLKVVNGSPFALTRHLARLQGSIVGLSLPPLADEAVRHAIGAVVAEADGAELARLRITYTAGSRGRTGLIVTVHAMTPWPPTATAVTVPWVRNERSPLAGLKTTSYADCALAARYAAERGASEAIFANTVGDLCEGSSTNVFVVVDGQVLTPPLASGCLPGVTRDLVLEWSEARECDLPYGVLREADEVFLTSSTRDIHPVTAVDDAVLGEPGPITASLRAMFAQKSRENIDP